jgi:hypothetical protein
MKKPILGLALAATLVAAWFAPDDENDLIAPAVARNASHKVATTPAPSAVGPATTGPAADRSAALAPQADLGLTIRPRQEDDELGSAFGTSQWQNPSPLKPAAARVAIQQAEAAKAANPSAAPAMPQIRVLGRYVEDGKVAYFLQVGERNVLARVGDKVGDDYHLDSDGPNGLTFTYLPLNKQQVLAAGDIN